MCHMADCERVPSGRHPISGHTEPDSVSNNWCSPRIINCTGCPPACASYCKWIFQTNGQSLQPGRQTAEHYPVLSYLHGSENRFCQLPHLPPLQSRPCFWRCRRLCVHLCWRGLSTEIRSRDITSDEIRHVKFVVYPSSIFVGASEVIGKNCSRARPQK